MYRVVHHHHWRTQLFGAAAMLSSCAISPYVNAAYESHSNATGSFGLGLCLQYCSGFLHVFIKFVAGTYTFQQHLP